MSFQAQDPEILIMKPLPMPYKYVYVCFAFIIRVYGDAKIVLALLPPRVVRLCWLLQM